MKNGTIWQHIYSIENARKFNNTVFLKNISFFFNKSFKGLKNFSERHCEVKKDFRLTCSTCRGSPLSPHLRSAPFLFRRPSPRSPRLATISRSHSVNFFSINYLGTLHSSESSKKSFPMQNFTLFRWRKPFRRRLSGSRDISK